MDIDHFIHIGSSVHSITWVFYTNIDKMKNKNHIIRKPFQI